MSISKRIFMAGCLTLCLFLVSAFQIQQPGCGEGLQVDEAGIGFPWITGGKWATADYDSNGTLIGCSGQPSNCLIVTTPSFRFGVANGDVVVLD